MEPNNPDQQNSLQPNPNPSPAPSVIPPQSSSPAPQAFPQSTQPPSNNQFSSLPGSRSKAPLVVAGAILGVILLGGIGFALLSSSNKKSANTNLTPRANNILPNQAIEPTPTAAKQEIPINKSIKNNLGLTFTVTKVVRNFPDTDLSPSEEGFLVEVKVESEGSYTGAVGKSDFRILASGGAEIRNAYLITDSDVRAGGYTPLPTQGVKKDQPVIGLVAFTIPKGATKITFRHHQPQTKILGGQTLPAKDFDVVIIE